MVNKSVCFLILVCLYSCGDKNERFSNRKTVGDFHFELIENSTVDPASQENLQTNMVDDVNEFILHIERVDGKDLMEYDGNDQEIQRRIYYFSYVFKEAIFIEQGEKKIPVAFYHMERTYGVVKKQSMILAFAKAYLDNNKAYQVVIDADMLNTGPVKFMINNPKKR